MKTSESVSALFAALAAAQAEIEPAQKDKVNPAFRSKYSDLTAVWAACRPALAKHKLFIIQEPTANEVGVSVVTRICHASGEWLELDGLLVPANKKDAHGYGSATSYAKRYALSSALGVVSEEDDDANAASLPPPVRQPSAGVKPGTPVNPATGRAKETFTPAADLANQVVAQATGYTPRFPQGAQ